MRSDKYIQNTRGNFKRIAVQSDICFNRHLYSRVDSLLKKYCKNFKYFLQCIQRFARPNIKYNFYTVKKYIVVQRIFELCETMTTDFFTLTNPLFAKNCVNASKFSLAMCIIL